MTWIRSAGSPMIFMMSRFEHSETVMTACARRAATDTMLKYIRLIVRQAYSGRTN